MGLQGSFKGFQGVSRGLEGTSWQFDEHIIRLQTVHHILTLIVLL